MGYPALRFSESEPEDERIAVNPPIEINSYSKPAVWGKTVSDESIWTNFWSNLRDTFFPAKLPPLELTSQPVAVPDPLAVKRDPTSSAIAFVTHGVIIALVLWMTLQARSHIVLPRNAIVTPIMIQPYIPVTVTAPKAMGGGGGGGAHQIVEASKGHLPPVMKLQTTAPQILKIDHPKLAAQPSVEMPQQISMPEKNMPDMGAPQSQQVAMASQGGGSGSGFGQGLGGGIGMGRGAGVGPGNGGGYGGGVMSVGGGVSAPQLIHSVQPEFTDEARQAKYQGVVSIQLIVDGYGHPENIQVIRHLDMGLDRKAIEAVQQYKFRPAMYQGHPVPVRLVVDVDFRLY